jgi:hypothetical protein
MQQLLLECYLLHWLPRKQLQAAAVVAAGAALESSGCWLCSTLSLLLAMQSAG